MMVLGFIGKCICWLFAIVIIIMIITLGAVIIDYITEKTAASRRNTKTDRATDTVSVLLTIDRVIESKLQCMHDFNVVVEQPFKMLHMDKDIETFIRNVKESLNNDVFDKQDDTLVTKEFLEDYIVAMSTNKMMEMYKATNAEIAHIEASKPQR